MVEANKQAAELPDYDDYVFEEEAGDDAADKNGAAAKPAGYVGVHSTSFKDMLLKPEL